MSREHMIVRCKECGLSYDMDFEEAPDDCGHEENWTVNMENCPEDCDIAGHQPDYTPPKFNLDLSEKPL